MASINAIISLTDRMTRPIQNIISSVNNLIDITERVAVANNQAFDVRQFDGVRRQLNLAQSQMGILEQATRNAANSQRQYNNEIRNGVNSADNLLSKIQSIAGAYIGIQGIKSLVNLSDNFSNTTARLNMIVDDDGSVEELQDKIMSSANRARASYTTTADAIAKLGIQASKAFSSNDELIAFAELLNKSFVNSGTSVEGVNSVMLQLTQSMAAGKLQGEELNAVLDNAAPIVQNIQKYLEEVMNIDASNIKELASEGKITAEIIKQSMFYAADEINTQFNSMPMTWGQVWNIFSNYALRASEPVLIVISWIANNMSWIAPIVLGVAASFVVYAAFAHGAAAATKVFQVAQAALNAVMALNPIGIVIISIIALISIIFAAVAAYNKFTNSSVSATGIIMGTFSVMSSFIGNKIVLLWNIFADFANFIGNFLNDPVAAVKILFLDMTQTVIGYIQNMIRGIEDLINKIPGVQVDITSGVDNYLEGIRNTVKQIKDESGWKEYVKKKDYTDYSYAFSKGYDIGAGIGERVSDFFGGGEKDIPFDSSGYGSTPYIPEDVSDKVGSIANNTADIADEVATTNENMEYLRKMAERDVVMRYVTPSINIDMSGMSNNIKNGMDIDGVIDHIVRKTSEAAEGMAEGV
ncbi:MAG: tape measure protein [Tyzzerella sp.]|uniref:Tape measure protein n=1 Tax=Candidatus Fimicola merdigallinarum TaxID=2840819 RepID=A0A9D9DY36_9FIRM|nr:tape measure protein [Candidatus Fimicola merdigallinarum]